jgi:hypothetical protein
VAFLAHSWLFLSPPASMVEVMNASIRPASRIFIGVAEVLAAVGLTLPGITRVLPWLISCAAAGLMIVMLSATVFHTIRGEISFAITTAILFVLVSQLAAASPPGAAVLAGPGSHLPRFCIGNEISG